VAVGDRAQLVGPNVRHRGPTRATGWNPPAGQPRLLLAADETAVPAVASILEGLPATARGTVLIEVPEEADQLPLSAPPGIRIEWVARGENGHGVLLSEAVRKVAGDLLTGLPTRTAQSMAQPVSQPADGPAIEPADDLDGVPDELWDVPEPLDQPGTAPVYAWLAGEAGCIAGLRRHLVRDLGLDRRSVAFMGYWRAGIPRVNA
jgi:NADPH-dependent ferric siderophore reductase